MKAFCILLLLCLTFLKASISAASSGEGVIYCVKPTRYATCFNYCQRCELLDYYFQYVDVTINRQKNVTMIFKNGLHTSETMVTITASDITLRSESREVAIVQSPYIHLINNSHVNIENLALNYIYIRVDLRLYSATAEPSLFQLVSAKLYGCSLIAYTLAIENANPSYTQRVKRSPYYYVLTGSSLQYGSLFIMEETTALLADCSFDNNVIYNINSFVKIHGTTEIKNVQRSAVFSSESTIALSGTISFVNNTATRGGAMALYSSQMHIDAGANLIFANNSAKDRGGAIYTDTSTEARLVGNIYLIHACFYQLLDCNSTAHYSIYFTNNSAENGGDDIYGTIIGGGLCSRDPTCNLTITHESNGGISSISSDPTRVCLCDNGGEPQCKNRSYVYLSRKIHPGETFSVSTAVVGGEFGTTLGTVHANFLNPKYSFLRPISQHGQDINSKKCHSLNYTIYSNQTNSTVIMYLSPVYMSIQDMMLVYMKSDCTASNSPCTYYTPVFFNITILSCPPGFTLLGDPPRCDCFQLVTDSLVECKIESDVGYFLWKGNMWINVAEGGITYSTDCPFDFCITTDKKIDLKREPDSQCAFNRAGRLCGGCKENYSLAIGSSHCIHCTTNNNLALLIFFAAAGFLLVFFISALNLTVTQGMINGLIFYANIVWTYQSIFYPDEQKIDGVLTFLKTFIAWINLDFGIETCFASELTSFVKTWLQFIFPLYIWAIAGLIIVAARYSTTLTSFLGSRAVPVLDTLFLLSYMKLLRIVTAAMDFSTVMEYPSNLTLVVWSSDGNFRYFTYPHILLFLAGLATLLLLWLPYTLLLLLMQWLRRLSHHTLFRWITRYQPVFDAYFAPLKLKHQYWCGVLLLTRGILLMLFTSTFAVPRNTSLLILLVFIVVLLFYTAIMHPYKSTAVLLLHCSFFTNLSLLTGFALFARVHPNGTMIQTVAIGVSSGLAFLQFCSIILYSIIAPFVPRSTCDGGKNEQEGITEQVVDVNDYTNHHNSTTDEAQPMLYSNIDTN